MAKRKSLKGQRNFEFSQPTPSASISRELIQRPAAVPQHDQSPRLRNLAKSMSNQLFVFDENTIYQNQSFSIDSASKDLKVSKNRIHQAISLVGSNKKDVSRCVREQVRIVVEDKNGSLRKVALVARMSDGVSVMCPYSNATTGLIIQTPLDYNRTFALVEPKAAWTAHALAKLSMHIDGGYVQFSSASSHPIPLLSGRYRNNGSPKGAGIVNDQPVDISSGPLCGVAAWGIEEYAEYKAKAKEPSEIFLSTDFWSHPRHANIDNNTINIEFFMFPKSMLNETYLVGGRLELTIELPFIGMFDFPHKLRVIEFPDLTFFLGVIISRLTIDHNSQSGFSLSSPGCSFLPDMEYCSLTAFYPRPFDSKHPLEKSLEYHQAVG